MKNIKYILTICLLSIYGNSSFGQLCKEGDSLFKQGRYKESVTKYRYCLEQENADKTATNLKIEKAEKCLDAWTKANKHQNDCEMAIEYYRVILNNNPQDKNVEQKIIKCQEKGELANVKIITETEVDTVYITDTIKNKETIVEHQTDTIYKIEIRQPEPNKKYQYLPFGIHQFCDQKDIGKGLPFSVTEAVCLGVGIGYYISAQNNLRKHNDPKYEESERDRFYDKYEKQLCTQWYWYGGAVVAIALNYCDNFNWFRKNINKNTSVELIPAPSFDYQGNPQMAMSLSIKF